MIVTTARKGADTLAEKAKMFSSELKSRFILREETSVQQLISLYEEDILIIGKDKVTLYSKHGGAPFFYHPSSAMFRVKQYLKTGYDPLVDIAGLKNGMTFLDCTLGLASDSLVAQVAVGANGHVTGLEANLTLAMLVRNGLRTWQDGSSVMLEAMKKIEVIHAHHKDYLVTLLDQSYDVVYFDPMFDQHITDSTAMKALKQFACHDDLSKKVINQALRVAKSRVVLKDHYQSERFKQFGFHVIKRQHAAFHYGYIDCSN